jgi:hypothetical protein
MSDKHYSPWSKTGIINNTILDIQRKRFLVRDNFDMEYTIENKYDLRPDLYSFYMYGTAKYWWIFATRNPDILFDPIYDFTTGTTIRVPQMKNIKGMR